MNQRMIKFPSIGQFREIIKNVHDHTRYVGQNDQDKAIYDPLIRLPKLTFTGTVKLHGTNAGVTMTKDGVIYAQSRENIITTLKDNAGFAFFVESNIEIFKKLFETIDIQDADYVTIFGEWAGGNIQKGVAINGLPKMFVIFAVKLSYEDKEKHNFFLPHENFTHLKHEESKIFNIFDFEKYSIDIDFENPKESQNILIELTNKVEAQCPVGKFFGKEGIGEGIVWRCDLKRETYWFKVKGEKHSSSKVKVLAAVDTEKLNSIREFVEYAITESRLNQGIEKIFTSVKEEITIKKTGDFLKWIVGDVIKEEMDTLIANKLEPKEVAGELSKAARLWFIEKCNSF